METDTGSPMLRCTHRCRKHRNMHHPLQEDLVWCVCVCGRYTDEEEVVTLYPQSAQTCMYIHIPGNSRLDDVGRVLGLMYTEWELLRKRLVGWLVTQTQ